MRGLRQQQGFTLPEMLVAMSLALIVFGATLAVLTAYTHFWQGSTQRLDAQNQARLAAARITRQLRNIASPISTPKLLERATPYDVVFQTIGTVSGANLSGAERVRYCIPQDTTSGTASNERLYSETQTWTTTTQPSSPWSSDSSVTIPCPDSPVPSGVGNPVVVANGVTNRAPVHASSPPAAFCFNNSCAPPTDLSKVFTVQVDLFENPTPSVPKAETELRDAAFLRNQPRAPVGDFTYTATGGGGVLLNGGISYSPDGQDLSYAWSCSPSCPDAGALSQSTGLVDWNPGAGTYSVTLIVTDQTGLVSPPKTYSVSVT